MGFNHRGKNNRAQFPNRSGFKRAIQLSQNASLVCVPNEISVAVELLEHLTHIYLSSQTRPMWIFFLDMFTGIDSE